MPLGATRFGFLGAPDPGKLELIETKNISSVSSAIFTSIQESTYNIHFLTVNDFQPSDDSKFLGIRFFESGVEESGNVYQYAYQFGRADGTFGSAQSTGTNSLLAGVTVGNQVNEQSNSYSYFYNLGDSSKYSFQTAHSSNVNNTTTYIMNFGSGVLPQASTVDQIKLFVSAGTFDCTFSLYGIKEYS